MKVEIWSDLVCPWCYIGKRRFEAALERFAHRDAVEVVWRSFELDPSTPRTATGTVTEYLAAKYGISVERAAAMNAQVTDLAAAEGLDYHLDRARHYNTFDAHRLEHLAVDQGVGHAVTERLLKAYFEEGRALGDPATLVATAAEAGLDPDAAREVLAGDRYADAVRGDEALARELGISGVPFFVFEEKYGVSGAQPAELLLQALQQVWEESKDAEITVGADDTSGAP